MREYAFFAIRNITKDNLLNQEWISKLEAQNASVHPALEKSGVKVDIESLKRKFSLGEYTNQ